MRNLLAATVALGLLAISIPSAHAMRCADGVYRAGCAGPNGAAVVRKPPPPPPETYSRGGNGTVNCASGPYRAGCAGPNGAAAVRRPY